MPQTLTDQIFDLLRESGALGPKDIADALDADYNVVQQVLLALKRTNRLWQPTYGKYEVASDADREALSARDDASMTYEVVIRATVTVRPVSPK